jgi:hypothetical protein
MNWRGVTEIVSGFIIKGKINPDIVNPTEMYPPYGEIIPLIRDGLELPDLVTKIGYSEIHTAIEACEHVNGDMNPLQWVKTLKQIASRAIGGINLKRIASAMEEGKEIDTAEAMQWIAGAESGIGEMTPLSEIKGDMDVWVPTGWQPLDRHVGGIVDANLNLIGASPGVGKTTLMIKLSGCMAKRHKKKKVAIYSLEMTLGQIAKRAKEILPDVTKDEKDRILISDRTYTVEEVYAHAARQAAQDRLSMICIDFADQLVEGEQSEQVMGKIYRQLSMLAKRTGVPVMLISQLSRSAYLGGIPKINHLRYSGMAEAMSALILLIHNPTNILVESGTSEELQVVPGKGYLLVGKSRYGFKEGGPGAIQVDWDGSGGWGDKSHGYFKLVA